MFNFSIYNLGIHTPVLTGTYKGILKSSHDNHQSEKPIALQVKQKWSSMKIYLTTNLRKLCKKVIDL